MITRPTNTMPRLLEQQTVPELSAETLVDPECGLIRSVRAVPHPSGAPHAYLALTASVSDARKLGEWPADRVSLGTTFGDYDQARIAAIAEGVERYCGNWLPANLDAAVDDEADFDLTPSSHVTNGPTGEFFEGSRDELEALGATVIALADLPHFATWQYRRPGFPYTELTETTPTLWTRCTEYSAGDPLTHGRQPSKGSDTWCPVSLVYLNWRQSRLRHLPRVHHLNYAGIATGQGVADAMNRGVIEVIERDALEVWWHLGGETFGIDPTSVSGLQEALEGSNLKVWIVCMPNEFAPAMAALVYDPDRDLYAAGFSAALDPANAARKAVLEAVHTWVYTQGCIASDGWVFRSVAQGLMARGLYLDFDPDANYLNAAGLQCENLIDLGAHVQVWLDPRMHEFARRFTEPALGTRKLAEVTPATMEEVYARLAARGHRILTRDLTTSDVRRTTLRVVRTLITGLVPNAPAAFAYLGMRRFPDAARERGWRQNFTGTPAEFTLVPPPHM